MISREPGSLIRIDEAADLAGFGSVRDRAEENFLLKFESDAQQTFQSTPAEFFLIVRSTPAVACLQL
ncbi:hypothetical protein CK489_05600 [Bradyrhizobium sp. UFLA03-84]|nr:hypothetical protein CK489_05600 [Bradyrhizobium sp. UFLA03-84]